MSDPTDREQARRQRLILTTAEARLEWLLLALLRRDHVRARELEALVRDLHDAEPTRATLGVIETSNLATFAGALVEEILYPLEELEAVEASALDHRGRP